MTPPEVDRYLRQADAHRQHIRQQLQCLVTILQSISTTVGQEMEATSNNQKGLVQAVWTTIETDKLLDYLHEHRSQWGDGGNFKDSTYNAAALALQPFLKSGRPKDVKSIKYKWGIVRTLYRQLTSHANTICSSEPTIQQSVTGAGCQESIGMTSEVPTLLAMQLLQCLMNS